MKLLSIIVPFYNSAEKCERLLTTLSQIQDPSVEVILIDDGSTDETPRLLERFKDQASVETSIITQDNRGPGGARNNGLQSASGTYVWFVDSDDDIKPEAIAILKEHSAENFDFVDFNIIQSTVTKNELDIAPAAYTDPAKCREILLTRFGHIWSKIFRKEMLVQNAISYPEFCLYEDNALLFVLPFCTTSFLKVPTVGYINHTDHASVTRSSINPRYFDRMKTAKCGFERSVTFSPNDAERRILEEKFVLTYLVNTAKTLRRTFQMTHWVTIVRVMSEYHRVAPEMNIRSHPFDLVRVSRRDRYIFNVMLGLSRFLPDQRHFFDGMRKQAWGKAWDTLGHGWNSK